MQIEPMIVRHKALLAAMRLRQKTPEDLSRVTGLDSDQIGSLIKSDALLALEDVGRVAIALGVSPMTLTDDPRMQIR